MRCAGQITWWVVGNQDTILAPVAAATPKKSRRLWCKLTKIWSASSSRGLGQFRSEPWIPATVHFLQFVVQGLGPGL